MGWLQGGYEDGKYVFIYDFHYKTAPDNIVISMKTEKPLETPITT